MEGTFEEKVVGLCQELQSYSSEIVDHIRALNSNYLGPTNVNLRNDPLNAIHVLKSDVRDIVEEAADRPEYQTKYRAEINECTHRVNFLGDVAATIEALSKADCSITGSDLIVATDELLELKDCVAKISDLQWGFGLDKVSELLRKESQILHHRFLSRLRRLQSNCIQIETGRIRVTHTIKGFLHGEELLLEEPISLADIWKVLVRLEAADARIIEIVRCLWRSMIVPLWKEKRVPAPRVVREDDASEFLMDTLGKDSVAPVTINNTGTVCDRISGPCRMAFPILLEHISHILDFMKIEVFREDSDVLNTAATALRTDHQNLRAVLSNTLTALMPKTEADLVSFSKSIEKACLDFESRHSVYFGSGLNSASCKALLLSTIVSDLSKHFANTRRKEVLSKARELVLADYHNTMMASGDAAEDDPSSAGDIGDQRALMEKSSGSAAFQTLRFEVCQVSLAACRLLKLLHDVMKQACCASPALAQVLYQSCRDCLELFIAIVPMKFSETIETMPRMGAVFYNDCSYIAHNTTLITHMYRKEFSQIDAALSASLGMVDFIQRFRLLGESTISNHLEKQREVLQDLVQCIQISPCGASVPNPVEESENVAPVRQDNENAGKIVSQKLHTAYEKKDAATTVKEVRRSRHQSSRVNDEDAAVHVTRHIERLASQWREVLQESVYYRFMGYLVEGVVRAVMNPILAAVTIHETAGSDISRILRSLQAVRHLFPAGSTGGDLSYSDEQGVTSVCVSWRKFCALADMLEYSLSEIAEQLPRRKFSSFTGAEMCSLVKALFENTPQRHGVITAILEMSS